MEAAAIVKKIRFEGGMTRKELAQLADVSPSTIGRIERGEMDPMWGTMQKVLAATGYQVNGNSVVASGDTSALQAALSLFDELLLRAESPTSGTEIPWATTVHATDIPWTERWERAGWQDSAMSLDNLGRIAVAAGNAEKVARRSAARIPVAVGLCLFRHSHALTRICTSIGLRSHSPGGMPEKSQVAWN